MEQEKKCENCKYYLAHYVKSTISFQKLVEGHCANSEIPWKIRKHNVREKDCCEKWEDNKEVKKEREENIKAVLKNMRKTLINIEKILTDGL